ncbi:MAG: phosphotransferase [Patescibacteria group bacterium]
MAKTNTDLEKIAKSLWSKFSIQEILELKKIPVGFKNKSYFIKSADNKEYVLKIYAQDFLTKSQIEERGKIVKKLEKSGIPVLEMVIGLDGNFAQEVKDDKAVYLGTLSKYIEVPFSEMQVDKNIVVNTAQELKRLHGELNKISYSNNFKTLNIKELLKSFLEKDSVNKITEYFENNRARINRLDEFLDFYKKEGGKLLKYFNDKSNSDKNQLNHGDFNLNNFLVENGKILKIFDFDEMLIAPKTFEIAISVYQLDYAEEIYTDELLEIFLKTYYEKSEITQKIIEEVLHFMKYRAFYRLARYFTYYQYTDSPGGHFTKFRRILENFNRIDSNELYQIVKFEK